MKPYEYITNGRVLCVNHNMLRCSECEYVHDLEEENKRYQSALKKILNNRQVYHLTRDDLIASFYEIACQALKE